ncbi:MAG: lipoyl(octanoyl) transferase LipB [Acidobacteriota bacterium]
MRELRVQRLGRVDYGDALALQRDLVDERRAGRIPDTLLLLEHPHVLTVGVRSSAKANIVASAERLAGLGVGVFEAGRGGDVTYHGPGQVVGYPILDLRPDRQDVHRYVRDLEEVVIRSCADFDVAATRKHGMSGAWVTRRSPRPDKIAAIGVRIARWITSHGFAFNVDVDLAYFDLIVPCGIADHGVTSLEAELGRPVSIERVEDSLVTHFAAVFARTPRETLRSSPADRQDTAAARPRAERASSAAPAEHKPT